ncbi:MAG TPA: FmdB family zinc ribbon protein [Ktedonobacterales bacterium]
MPMYDYRCQSCGTRFEVWQKMTDDPLTTCQTCGGPVRRVLYPAGIVFKGSGFYSTDHRSNNGSTVSASASDKNTDAKTESTPAKSAPAESASTAATTKE